MAGKLKALEVGHKKPGTHGDGGGLYLVVSPKGARKWVFRFKISGKQSLMGVRGGDKAGHWSGAICDRGGVKSSQW